MTENLDVSELRQWTLLKKLYENPTVKFGTFLKNNSYPHQAGKYYTQIRNKNVLVAGFPPDKQLMFIEANVTALKECEIKNLVELPRLVPEPELKAEPEPELKAEPEPELKAEPELKLEPELKAALTPLQEERQQIKSSKHKQPKEPVLVDVRQLPSVNRIKLLDLLAELPVGEKLKMISILKDLPLEEKCNLINLFYEL